MYPSFRLDRPDETADDILEMLAVLGGTIDIPKLLIRVATECMERYTGDAGQPIFSGDSYFEPHMSGAAPSPSQRNLDVVDSFSMSITLTLATIGFSRVFRSVLSREDLRQEVDKLEALASARLSAAMVGLLRCFSVNVFDTNSTAGRALCRVTNQSGLSERRIVEDLQRAGGEQGRPQHSDGSAGHLVEVWEPGEGGRPRIPRHPGCVSRAEYLSLIHRAPPDRSAIRSSPGVGDVCFVHAGLYRR